MPTRMGPTSMEHRSETSIIDAHGHTLDLAFKSGRHLHQSLDGLTDVPLLRAGGVAAQLTACWMPDVAIGGPHGSQQPLDDINRMLDYLDRELEGEAGEQVALARTAGDIETARGQGKVALVLGLEGGDALQGDPKVLRQLHGRGLRHVGLVHEGPNALATATQVWEGGTMRLHDASVDPSGGLSKAGRQIVHEMNLLGLLLDVTHMIEPAFWDTLETTTQPVIVSHGNARSLRDTVRYLTDEQIRAVAETGGLVCPSPFPLGPSEERPSLNLLLDHIDYMIGLVGADHVGFGSDFLDQTGSRPPGLGDISQTCNIVKGLQRQGHSRHTRERILSGNFLRVFRAVAG